MHEIVQLHHRMFVSKSYDWWREVRQDDIVVDIGAGVGLFSAKALDIGAKRVYMIEPSKSLLKTAISNVSDYIIGEQNPKVIPVWAAIGKTDIDRGNVFGCKKQPPGSEEADLITFQQLVERYNIKHIDYLKVAAEGAEFGILQDSADFIAMNVRHVTIMVHMNAQYGSPQKFVRWRDTFLKPFIDLGRVKFQEDGIKEKMFSSNCTEELPSKFMVYITNW